MKEKGMIEKTREEQEKNRKDEKGETEARDRKRRSKAEEAVFIIQAVTTNPI